MFKWQWEFRIILTVSECFLKVLNPWWNEWKHGEIQQNCWYSKQLTPIESPLATFLAKNNFFTKKAFCQYMQRKNTFGKSNLLTFLWQQMCRPPLNSDFRFQTISLHHCVHYPIRCCERFLEPDDCNVILGYVISVYLVVRMYDQLCRLKHHYDINSPGKNFPAGTNFPSHGRNFLIVFWI